MAPLPVANFCLSDFYIAIIWHHDQGNIMKKVSWDLNIFRWLQFMTVQVSGMFPAIAVAKNLHRDPQVWDSEWNLVQVWDFKA